MNKFSVFKIDYCDNEYVYFIRNDMIPKGIESHVSDDLYSQVLIVAEFDEEFVDRVSSIFMSYFNICKICKINNINGNHILKNCEVVNRDLLPNDNNYCLLRNRHKQRFRVRKTEKNGLLGKDTYSYLNLYEGGLNDLNKLMSVIGEHKIIELNDASGNELIELMFK